MATKRKPPREALPPMAQSLIAPPGSVCPRCRKPFPGGIAYDPDPRRRGAQAAICGECLKEER